MAPYPSLTHTNVNAATVERDSRSRVFKKTQMNEQVRPLYEALMGCLSSAPTPKDQGYILDAPIWGHYHDLIEKLNGVTKEDYGDHKVQIISDQDWGQKISVQEYRTKLNSLIMFLHGKFLSTDNLPFSGNPGVIVTQSQNQSQNMQITIITQAQDLIDKRLYGEKLDEKEKTFLEKIKTNLAAVRNIAELIQVIITVGKGLGMDAGQIARAFGF